MSKYKKAIILSFIFVLTITVICIGSSYSLFKVDKKGQIHNKILTGNVSNSCDFEDGYIWNYEFSGSEEEFTVPCDGIYKIEAWGASGGTGKTNGKLKYAGGNGSYTKGDILLNQDDNLYIYVGEAGKNAASVSKYVGGLGGFNGGAKGGDDSNKDADPEPGGGGGGSTDIRLVSGNNDWSNFDSLKSRIMVSAGAGGGNYAGIGGSGGGIQGTLGVGNTTPVTQTSGYAFGSGMNGSNCSDGGGGAGSGYYGGFSATNGCGVSGEGGSSFISGHLGCDAIDGNSTSTNIIHTNQEFHYSGFYFINTTMIDGDGYTWNEIKGDYVGQPQPDGTTAQGHTGNGYLRITLINSKDIVSPPVISKGGKFQGITTVSIRIPGKSKSGVNYYEYFITQENITPTNDTIPSGTTDNEVQINQPGTYDIYYRTVSSNGKKSEWSTKETIEVFNCPYEINQIWVFDYTGSEQSFIIPCSGTYKLETWGAQGGYGLENGAFTTAYGGYGGYSIGNKNFTFDQNVYINIGGAGQDAKVKVNSQGGFNGGGNGRHDNNDNESSGGGGGATDIKLSSGLLSTFKEKTSDILIVSGGGAGGTWTNAGGAGGGYVGNPGSNSSKTVGGSQTSGYSFGQGGIGAANTGSPGGGGGGGFYGGIGGSGDGISGAGGSGYIGNTTLTNKTMYCYNCTESSEESTKTVSTTCHSSTPTENCAKEGNGYARITLISID